MTDYDYNEIVRLAALFRKVELDPDAFDAMDEIDKWMDEAAKIDVYAPMMVMAASKLMGGKPYSISSDNPKAISNMRLLAQHIGASVEETKGDAASDWPPDKLATIILSPPSCKAH